MEKKVTKTDIPRTKCAQFSHFNLFCSALYFFFSIRDFLSVYSYSSQRVRACMCVCVCECFFIASTMIWQRWATSSFASSKCWGHAQQLIHISYIHVCVGTFIYYTYTTSLLSLLLLLSLVYSSCLSFQSLHVTFNNFTLLTP